MKSPLEHAHGLMRKAEHDLITAQATLATEQALDMVCFHAQQAVEKSLKALLALHDVVYPLRHDLGELIRLANSRFPQLHPLEEDILTLSPYAVDVRYDNQCEPDQAEAQETLTIARRVYALARQIVGKQQNNNKEMS